MPTPRLHPDRAQTSSERRARWVKAHMKKDRAKFNLVWPTELVELLKREAATYDLSVSQLLAVALLVVHEHHDEMPERIRNMRLKFFPDLAHRP